MLNFKPKFWSLTFLKIDEAHPHVNRELFLLIFLWILNVNKYSIDMNFKLL